MYRSLILYDDGDLVCIYFLLLYVYYIMHKLIINLEDFNKLLKIFLKIKFFVIHSHIIELLNKKS